MRIEETAREIVLTFDSIGELATTAEHHSGEYLRAIGEDSFSQDFYGVNSWGEANTLATEGWSSETEHALSIAENAVSTVTRDHTVPTFHPVWDVSGCEVDVARYLADDPECMVDYELTPTPQSGRVISICAGVAYSSAVSTETIKCRGYVVVALAVVLSRLGYSTELWADDSGKGDDGKRCRMRTLVKGPNDELDPAKIMFAYAHPAMSRVLSTPAMHSLPKSWQSIMRVGRNYGVPIDPKQDLPEGTIYIPCVCSNRDVPDADVALLRYMRDLGIVDD